MNCTEYLTKFNDTTLLKLSTTVVNVNANLGLFSIHCTKYLTKVNDTRLRMLSTTALNGNAQLGCLYSLKGRL